MLHFFPKFFFITLYEHITFARVAYLRMDTVVDEMNTTTNADVNSILRYLKHFLPPIITGS